MLKAIIIVCALAGPCDEQHATDLMRTPVATANPSTCFMQGQAFLAQMSIGRELQGQRVVIRCKRMEG
jgi:hypothetical protein